MTTDEDKSKISKLLDDLKVPEVKLTERCSDIIKDFRQKFGKEVEIEENKEFVEESFPNPYRADKVLLEDTNRRLQMLLAESKRIQKEVSESVIQTSNDPKRPWRIHSDKEKLLRINSELREHHEKGSQAIAPLKEENMKILIKECRDGNINSPPLDERVLKSTVDSAKRDLPNFQYKKSRNSTATAIMADAHEEKSYHETITSSNESKPIVDSV